jgi:tRNA U34 5-methylaminomethyl-2-thiouridine-forming methyltransferase MnmC
MNSKDKKESFELVTLRSGHKSLRLANTLQTFHPGIGPLAEAEILYVRGQKLIERTSLPGKFVIWDVGLGAAANALSAIHALSGQGQYSSSEPCVASVEIHSFEQSLEPLRFAIQHAEELQYLKDDLPLIESLLANGSVQIHENLKWILHPGDFRETMQRLDIPSPQAIFYDPYSLAVNPELWSVEHFQKLRARLDDTNPCLLTNYTRSTALRATLILAGFYVGIGSTIGNKEETTVVSNSLDLIENPLDENWLKRVRASQNANPIRVDRQSYGPISEEDYQLLITQKQFQRPGL